MISDKTMRNVNRLWYGLIGCVGVAIVSVLAVAIWVFTQI